jgi:hypothetical protein
LEEEKEAKVVVGIPASSSKILIERTVRHLWGVVDDIFVCDNGTADLVSMKTKYMGCATVSHPPNLGYFSSIRYLMNAALNARADVLVIVDAGIKCTKLDIENLAKPIVFEDCDIVVGVNREENNENDYVIASMAKTRRNLGLQGKKGGEDDVQLQHIRPKAYGKNAMLQLLVLEEKAEDLSNRPTSRRPLFGLKIRECPITIYNGLSPSEKKAEKQPVNKIRPPRRGTRTARKAATLTRNLADQLSSALLIEIGKLSKSIPSIARKYLLWWRKKYEIEGEKNRKEKLQQRGEGAKNRSQSEPSRKINLSKLRRSIRAIFAKIKEKV